MVRQIDADLPPCGEEIRMRPHHAKGEPTRLEKDLRAASPSTHVQSSVLDVAARWLQGANHVETEAIEHPPFRAGLTVASETHAGTCQTEMMPLGDSTATKRETNHLLQTDCLIVGDALRNSGADGTQAKGAEGI